MRIVYAFLLLFFLLTEFSGSVFAQRKSTEHASKRRMRFMTSIPPDSIVRSVNFDLHFGLHTPVGTLAQRFGGFKSTGFGIFYKTHTNWLIGADGDYYFGKLVKEDSILKHIQTADGNIIASDGQYAEIKLYGRGYFVGAKLGKVYPFTHQNSNTGLAVCLRAGYFQHRIKILGDADVYQLSKSYKMGYDRLTSGFSISQSIQYFHMSRNSLINYTIGLDLLEGFTQGQRAINFDTGKSGLDKRLDLLIGLKASWMLPVFIRNKNSEYTF